MGAVVCALVTPPPFLLTGPPQKKRGGVPVTCVCTDISPQISALQMIPSVLCGGAVFPCFRPPFSLQNFSPSRPGVAFFTPNPLLPQYPPLIGFVLGFGGVNFFFVFPSDLFFLWGGLWHFSFFLGAIRLLSLGDHICFFGLFRVCVTICFFLFFFVVFISCLSLGGFCRCFFLLCGIQACLVFLCSLFFFCLFSFFFFLSLSFFFFINFLFFFFLGFFFFFLLVHAAWPYRRRGAGGVRYLPPHSPPPPHLFCNPPSSGCFFFFGGGCCGCLLHPPPNPPPPPPHPPPPFKQFSLLPHQTHPRRYGGAPIFHTL